MRRHVHYKSRKFYLASTSIYKNSASAFIDSSASIYNLHLIAFHIRVSGNRVGAFLKKHLIVLSNPGPTTKSTLVPMKTRKTREYILSLINHFTILSLTLTQFSWYSYIIQGNPTLLNDLNPYQNLKESQDPCSQILHSPNI